MDSADITPVRTDNNQTFLRYAPEVKENIARVLREQVLARAQKKLRRADYTKSPTVMNYLAKGLNLLSNVAAKVEVSKNSLDFEVTPFSLGLSKKV